MMPEPKTPETVSELADHMVAWLTLIGMESVKLITDADVFTDEMRDQMEPGWDTGQAFIGLTLPGGDGIGVSISLGITP